MNIILTLNKERQFFNAIVESALLVFTRFLSILDARKFSYYCIKIFLTPQSFKFLSNVDLINFWQKEHFVCPAPQSSWRREVALTILIYWLLDQRELRYKSNIFHMINLGEHWAYLGGGSDLTAIMGHMNRKTQFRFNGAEPNGYSRLWGRHVFNGTKWKNWSRNFPLGRLHLFNSPNSYTSYISDTDIQLWIGVSVPSQQMASRIRG